MLESGTLILNNKYRIEELVGEGAFAQVYRATHLELNVARAIKVLRVDAPGVGSTAFNDYRERYRQEFRIAARLDHPNVIKVYDLIEEQGALYAVLEFAPNGSVKDLLAKHGALPIDRAVQILLDCAAGLDALHEKLGVIHRDIKPSNILLDADGHAKIADLGLAQVGGGQSSMRSELGSAAGNHPGTQLYRSPEHNTWEPLAPTSDAYSLGCVAFEMLTGQIWKHVMHKAERVRDLRPDVPEWLDAIVARMLCDTPGLRKSDADNPQKRYVTMSAFGLAIREQVDNEARAKQEAAEKAMREAEERKRREAEEQARRESEAKAQRAREERARREREERVKREVAQKRQALIHTAFIPIGWGGVLLGGVMAFLGGSFVVALIIVWILGVILYAVTGVPPNDPTILFTSALVLLPSGGLIAAVGFVLLRKGYTFAKLQETFLLTELLKSRTDSSATK